MPFTIHNIKTEEPVVFDLETNEFVIEENQEYSVKDANGKFTLQDFQTIGSRITEEIGTLKSTNKVGVFRLKNVNIRVRSKLGDNFFQKLKEEIASVEKQLLLSTNGIEEQLALSHGQFLEEVATSLLLESWATDKLNASLRFIFTNPNFGFANKSLVKNMSRGDVLSDIDFQYMQKSPRQLATHKGKVIPIVLPSAIRQQTYDVLEMRFMKFFLFFCFNLLEKRTIKLKYEISELEKKVIKLKANNEQDNRLKITSTDQQIAAINEKSTSTNAIKVKINSFLRSDVLKQVRFTGDLDFTSLKLHNHFHFKKLLQLYLKMRKSFEPLSSDNLVYLDINSLENLYEYYCLIKLLKDFEVEPEAIKALIKSDKSGWIIDKSIGVPLGTHADYSYTLFFKKNFSRGLDSYSQSYDPDYTIKLTDVDGAEQYLHLDAKYKHTNGYVKKEDIDKMHTYTHAIKKSKGALVLFPGKKNTKHLCFNTIIGALFCNPVDKQNLKTKILEIISN
jgi:predicted component of viral defense system (DUF524 family)